MVTQWTEELPEGKSTPDFIRKPIALTIQEGEGHKTEHNILYMATSFVF